MTELQTTKPFDQETHDECDPRARAAISCFLFSRGHEVFDNPNIYKIDLYYESGWPEKERFWVEVEVKELWEGPWPKDWDTVHILQRKAKYLRGLDPKKAMFFVLDNDLSQAWYVPAVAILDLQPIITPNKSVPSGELMFHVPIGRCRLFDLREEAA